MASSEISETDLNIRLTHVVRCLTTQEKEKMERQNTRLVSEFKAQKSEENSRRNWDIFYKRNEDRFFKDRHWTTREFQELLGLKNTTDQKLSILEVGCGVGNMIFPLLSEDTNLFIYACDFSQRAVDLVKSNKLYNESRVRAFQADITNSGLFDHLLKESVNIVTLIFVLSAIHPDKFLCALKNIHSVLKGGGVVLIRDYGIHDMTQIRFKPGHKIMDNFYLRQDGTLTYFFTLEKLKDIFLEAGFTEVNCSYIEGRTINRKENIDVPRVFIQAKFLKS